DPPGRAAGVPPAHIEVAAGVDREARVGGERAGGQVDRQAFDDGDEVEVERDVAEADAVLRGDAGVDGAIGAVAAVEAAGLEGAADGRVEGAAARPRHRQGEANRLEEDRTDLDRLAGAGGQAHDLALRLEAAADRLDLAEPAEGALDAAGALL